MTGSYFERATVIRSRRRTLAMEIRPDGQLLVRAPQRLSERRIRQFVEARADWIEAHLAKTAAVSARAEAAGRFTPAEKAAMIALARRLIPERVRVYAPMVGVTVGRISIRTQKTRWGSCSRSGNLSFSALLTQVPPEVLDAIVVHELCHRKHMNHSAAFYDEVRRVLPDYDRRARWLRENGAVLLRRMESDD
ncbi:MAG: M48 family metallopeptidase [Clostridia bacterium]|nr:M48 family metallopeptidase [Clostridia bacterium]